MATTEDQAKAAYCQPECDWTAKITHFIGAKITINTCQICGRYDSYDINRQIDMIIQLAKEQERVDNERRRIALKLVYDLDRCPHGRHEGDSCAGWRPEEGKNYQDSDPYHHGCRGGYSLGNPHLKVGEPFGYGLSGMTHYILPERIKRHDALNYVRPEPGRA